MSAKKGLAIYTHTYIDKKRERYIYIYDIRANWGKSQIWNYYTETCLQVSF